MSLSQQAQRLPDAPLDFTPEQTRVWNELIRVLEAQQDALIAKESVEAITIGNWLGLGDTPSSYSSQAGKFPQVNVGESALAFLDLFGNNNTWTGTNTFSGTTSGIDHGDLGGLGDNDHTQYVLKPSSTNNAVTRFNGSAGAIQNSGVIIDDNENVSGLNTLEVGTHNVTGAGSAGFGASHTITGTLCVGFGNGMNIKGNANILGGWGGTVVDTASVFNMGNMVFSNIRKCSYNFISGIVLGLNNAQSNAVFGSSSRVGVNALGGSDSLQPSWYNLVAGDGHIIEANSYAAVMGRANKLGDDTGAVQTGNVVLGAYLQTMYSGCVMLGSGVNTSNRLTATADNQFWLGFNSTSYTMFGDANGINITYLTADTRLTTDGGRFKNLVEKADNYTLTATDEVVVFDITTDKIATLPDPTTNTGQVYSIVNKYSSTANLTFSRTIDGDATLSLIAQENITIISDGTEYLVYE